MGRIEPAPCMVCGVDTTPCIGRRGCRHAGRWEWYMVIPRVWAAAAGPSTRGFMCIGCLQRKLGRPLRSTDFTAAPVNNPDHPWKTPRLREAMLRD